MIQVFVTSLILVLSLPHSVFTLQKRQGKSGHDLLAETKTCSKFEGVPAHQALKDGLTRACLEEKGWVFIDFYTVYPNGKMASELEIDRDFQKDLLKPAQN